MDEFGSLKPKRQIFAGSFNALTMHSEYLAQSLGQIHYPVQDLWSMLNSTKGVCRLKP